MFRRLLLLEPLWLLVLMPMILFPGRLLPASWQPGVVLALFAFWPLRWLHWRLTSGRWIMPLQTPVSLAVLLLLLWLPVNIWAAVDTMRAWEHTGYLLLGVAFFVALVNSPLLQRAPQWLAWLLIAFVTALAVVGPFLMVEAKGLPGVLAVLQRLATPLTARLGETINPNILAGALVALLPIVLAMATAPRVGLDNGRRRWHWLLRLLLFMIVLLIVAVIVLSGSRGAQLAIGASLLIWLFLRYPVLVWTTPLLLIGIAALIDNIDFVALLDSAGGGSAVGGLDERMEIWGRAIYAMQDFAFTGVGIGHFNQVIPLLYPYFLISPSVDIPHAHNWILQVGVDLGFPGLIAWLAVLLALFVLLFNTILHPPSSLARSLAAGLVAALVAILVHGIVDAALWGTKLAFVPWLLFALCVSISTSRQAGETMAVRSSALSLT